MGGASPDCLDGSVGVKLSIYAFVCICYGNIYAFSFLNKNYFINNLQALPIISILILSIRSVLRGTAKGRAYFAATGHKQGKYRRRRDLT